MGTVNRMSTLLDKIERRLGVRYILEQNPELNKDKWEDVIMNDTMDTFSRYFPHKIVVRLNSDVCKFKNGHYVINEELLNPLDIIGIGDIDWGDPYFCTKYNSLNGGVYDQFQTNMNVMNVGLVQGMADLYSLFNMGIYLTFEEPNIISIQGVGHYDILKGFKELPLNVFVKHKSLITISPTKMEIFERLATSDVARYLYGELKHFDGYDTNYGQLDLKMEDLRDEAQKREQIIDELDNGYVNPANRNQPMMFTI